MFRAYAAIEQQGGIAVTMSQTGQGLTLRPKLYEAHKEKCVPVPQVSPGEFECHMRILVSLSPDGRDPSEQGARIGVKRDASGDWVAR